ncbi:MAG: P63C domain-containing protein [Gammaproteobacteria bacterium]|nr:P63C domain-containing protein [Gammaproteobacteria bacterium]
MDRYLTSTRAAWAKTFPDEFYKEIFRLKGWKWQGMNINRPQVVGHYTNDIVYARLASASVSSLIYD